MKYLTYTMARLIGICFWLQCCFLLFTQATNAQNIKVMSYNIHHGENIRGQIDLREIGRVIKKSGADLVGLQEVDSVCARSNKEDQMKVLAELTGMYYTFKKHFDYDGGSYGLGILSKYPFDRTFDERISSYPEGSSKTLVLLVTDIEIAKGSIVRFATVHFDYREDPTIRLAQSSETLDFFAKNTYPVILTGDLNAEPNTREIKGLGSMFTDTDISGKSTYPADGPSTKIDYILVSGQHLKKVKKHKVINEPVASDHRPVMASIVLKN
ncbi:MAG: endonuclease/exonuclease/phosphatase family protein [Bacteroidota bacterium]